MSPRTVGQFRYSTRDEKLKWLKKHPEVLGLPLSDIVIEMKKAGLYSKTTIIADARYSVRNLLEVIKEESRKSEDGALDRLLKIGGPS